MLILNAVGLQIRPSGGARQQDSHSRKHRRAGRLCGQLPGIRPSWQGEQGVAAVDYYSDSRPYSESHYDALGRVTKVDGEGKAMTIMR